MGVPRIQYYTDARHPLIYMYEPPMQPEEMCACVDELAGSPVEALHFCLGDGRTVMHESVSTELWGDNVGTWPHVIFHRAHRNAKQLIERGHDPLRVVCERGAELGLPVVPAVLCNQGRGPREGSNLDVRCSEWRFDNQHLEIGASGPQLPAHFPGDTCLNFKHAAVREERLRLIEETLIKYGSVIGGLELVLNYVPYYFHPSEVAEGRQIMTEFIAHVSKLVANR